MKEPERCNYKLIRGVITVGDIFTKDFVERIIHIESGSVDRLTVYYFIPIKKETKK